MHKNARSFTPLRAQLDHYASRWPGERDTVDRFVTLLDARKDCFERTCWQPGHITGSAWLVDSKGQRLLLTHHRKLGMWLQLGGHSDGDPDTAGVALREAREESGLTVALAPDEAIFDIDIHEIPARKSDPAHLHFDVRYVVRTQEHDFTISAESLELAWVAVHDLERKTQETSILRMRDKWIAYENTR